MDRNLDSSLDLTRDSSAHRVAVIGSSGYGGLQLVKLLNAHPNFRITFLGGKRSIGKKWSQVCSFLPIEGDPEIKSPNPDKISEKADFAVLSLPNGLSCQLAPLLLKRGLRVVDLSADYRYRSLEQWNKIYSDISTVCIYNGFYRLG